MQLRVPQQMLSERQALRDRLSNLVGESVTDLVIAPSVEDQLGSDISGMVGPIGAAIGPRARPLLSELGAYLDVISGKNNAGKVQRARAPVAIAQKSVRKLKEVETGKPVTVHLYRGGTRSSVPGRGTFLTDDIEVAEGYSNFRNSRLPTKSMTRGERKLSKLEKTAGEFGPKRKQYIENSLRQYEVTMQNPYVSSGGIDEPHHWAMAVREMLDFQPDLKDISAKWSFFGDQNVIELQSQLAKAGIDRHTLDKVVTSKNAFRESDRLMHRFLKRNGYDAAVFPDSGYVQLVDPTPKLPK